MSNGEFRPRGQVIDAVIASILADERTRHLGTTHLPERDAIIGLVEELKTLVFPGFFGQRELSRQTLPGHIESSIGRLAVDLHRQIQAALHYARMLMEEAASSSSPEPGSRMLIRLEPGSAGGGADGPRIMTAEECDCRSAEITHAFLSTLPEVRRRLSLDVQAALDGDPAAEHTDETIFCYPGVMAIMVHRLAHELYRLNVPLLPRIMSEHAHSITGIDIHPGANIGESFFIDHGTGVVIGETTDIGRHCKIYQGVTLGARSFPKDERGRLIRGVKRHPTLGDRVTVYASATILGGDTVIGEGCVISGGVFLTRSVPPGHIVRAIGPELVVRTNPEADGFESGASGI